jgi:hypothetical protein
MLVFFLHGMASPLEEVSSGSQEGGALDDTDRTLTSAGEEDGEDTAEVAT